MSRAPFQIYQDQSVDALPSPSRRRPVRGLQVRQPEPQPGNARPQNSPSLQRIGFRIFQEEYFEPSFDSTTEDEPVPILALGGIPLEYAATHPIQPRGPRPLFIPPPFEIYEDPNASLEREGILPGIGMVDWFDPIEQEPPLPQIPHRCTMFQLLQATGPKRKGRRATQRQAPNVSVAHEDGERRQSNAYRQPRATPARAQQRAPMARQEVRQTPSQRTSPVGRTPQREPFLSPFTLEEMYDMQEELRRTRDMDRELLGMKRPYEEERSPQVRPFPARETPRRNDKRSERDMAQGGYPAPPQTSSPARTMGNLNWDEMQMSPLTLEQLVWIRQGAGLEEQGPQKQGGSPMRATSSRSETRICLDIGSGASTSSPRSAAAQHLPSCTRRNEFSPVNTGRPQRKSNTPYRPRPERRAGEEEEASGADSTLECSWQTISDTMLTSSDGSELYEERSFDTLVIKSEGCPTPEVMRGGEDENESPYSMIDREEGQMRGSSKNARQRDFSAGSDDDLVRIPHNVSVNISMASLRMVEVPVGPSPPPPSISDDNSVEELGREDRRTQFPRGSPQRMPTQDPGGIAAPQTPQGSAQGNTLASDYNNEYDRNQRYRQSVRGVQSTGKKVQPLRGQIIPKKPASARKTKPGDENIRLHLHACATHKSERATPRRTAPTQPVGQPRPETARRSPQRVEQERVSDGYKEQEGSPQRTFPRVPTNAADWITETVLHYMDPKKFPKPCAEGYPELRPNFATRNPRTPEKCPVCSPLHIQGPPIGSPIPPPSSPEDISPIRGGEHGELEGYRQADYYNEERQMPPTQWISPGLDYTYEYLSPPGGCFSDYILSIARARPGDKVTLPERRRVLVTREKLEKKKKEKLEREAEMEREYIQHRKERAAKERIKKEDPTPAQEVDELEKCLSEFLAAQSSWMTWRADMPATEPEKKDGDLQERIIPSDTTPPEDQRVKSEMLNTEFMYYAALLKKHSPNVKDKNTRNCLAKWAKKLFGPEYHVKIEFQEKRNRYLMALTIGVMSNNLLKIFRDSPRPGRLGDPDFKLEPKTVARWEKDNLWNDVLMGLPDPGVLEKPCGQHGDEICPESRAAKSGLDGKRGSNTKEKDLKESALLDKEYRFLLYLAKELAIKLEDPYEKTTAAVWLHALSGVADDATAEKYARREEMAEKYGKTVKNWPCPLKRGVRNDYIQALLPYLLESRLDAPFLRGPPDNGDGGSLVNLKRFVPWSTMGKGNLSPTSTLADKFLFKQPVPKEGAFAFVALSGDSLNLWFPGCEEQGDDGNNKDAGAVITTTRSQITIEFEETYNPEG